MQRFAPQMLFIQGVHVCTACKNSSFRTVLRGLPMPAHLIGSPNPLVSPRTPKGADQPAQCLKTLFSRFFCAPKGVRSRFPERRNHFQRLVEGPGPRRRQEVVQLPHSRRPASRQPARRVAAALRRRGTTGTSWSRQTWATSSPRWTGSCPRPCAGRSGPRTATPLPWWTGASRR